MREQAAAVSSGEEADHSDTGASSPTPRHSVDTVGSCDSGVGGGQSDTSDNIVSQHHDKGWWR